MEKRRFDCVHCEVASQIFFFHDLMLSCITQENFSLYSHVVFH
jgi:hypothetical protein